MRGMQLIATAAVSVALLVISGCGQDQQRIQELEKENTALKQEKESVSNELASSKSSVEKLQADLQEAAGAQDKLAELTEQLEANLDASRTRLVPLLSNGRAVAVIACELNYPGDADFFAERFAPAASMAGTVLGLALARERQQHLLEQLVQIEGTEPRAGTGAAEPTPAGETPQPAASETRTLKG